MQNQFMLSGILQVRSNPKNPAKPFAELLFIGGKVNLRGEFTLSDHEREVTIEGKIGQDKWGVQFHVSKVF